MVAPTCMSSSAEVSSVENGANLRPPNLRNESERPLSTVFEAEKRAVYRHPLFPLLALLFEKCENATNSPDHHSSENLALDLQAFVQHQRKDAKPFFSNDAEVDNLMVKAIQVMRIHLLELEKVQELCKDFCNRYINSLKDKMHSENLLRTEYNYDSDSSGPSDVDHVGSDKKFGDQIRAFQACDSNSSDAFNASMCALTPSASADHAPVSPPGANHASTSDYGARGIGKTCLGGSCRTIDGIDEPRASDHDDDNGCAHGKRKSKRGILPKQATTILKSWLFQHIVHPYPTEDQKRSLASQTNLTLLQVNNWFINARRRILQPMLDASSGNNIQSASSSVDSSVDSLSPKAKRSKSSAGSSEDERYASSDVADVENECPNA